MQKISLIQCDKKIARTQWEEQTEHGKIIHI